jgi:hypothetical protein
MERLYQQTLEKLAHQSVGELGLDASDSKEEEDESVAKARLFISSNNG